MKITLLIVRDQRLWVTSLAELGPNYGQMTTCQLLFVFLGVGFTEMLLSSSGHRMLSWLLAQTERMEVIPIPATFPKQLGCCCRYLGGLSTRAVDLQNLTGPRTPMHGVFGPKYHNLNGIWDLPRPSNVVTFGGPSKNPNPKTIPSPKKELHWRVQVRPWYGKSFSEFCPQYVTENRIQAHWHDKRSCT